ncbi:fibronectin type III domain-containing protein, partial [Spirosoma litoris]
MTRLLQLVLAIGFFTILKPTCAVSAINIHPHLPVLAPATQPTQAQIDAAASEAQSQGRLINITPGGLTIPAALQEVASLPVTFRSTIGNWNYDITVLSMRFTPTGSVLSIGCRFYLPGSTTNTSLYFGANDIAVSGKSGFTGDLPILESLLSEAKSSELDDPTGKLGGQTKFVEFPVSAFQGKAWMGLGKDTKLSFSCGEFKKFSLSGFLKVYDLVEREDPAGQSLTDGKPLLFFWGTKDVFDWQDIYFPVTASRGFHSTNADDIGFHPTDKTNAILDLSLYQSPANLPDCGGGSLGDSWQGIQFDAFAIRLPKLFRLRNPHTLMGQGTNLFLSPNGVIGTVTADKVFALEEGYTDEINKFDLSLDQVTANFSCGASANISMSGRFRLGTCGTGGDKAKELYYNVVYTEQDRRYQVLIKESATDRFKNNGLTLSTGSTLSLSIQNESFVFQTALPAKPRLSTPAYNNSICLNYPTTLTASNCESINSKWSTGEIDKGTVTINPKATTTYKINCFDKYCINEDSDKLTITVYESLPQPTLTATSLAFCTYQNAVLKADQCVGKLEWQTPDNGTFRELSSNQQTAYFPGQVATTTFAYKVRCNLNTCLSPEKPLSLTVYPEPKAPSLSSNATNNTIDRNNEVTISGSCPDNNSIIWDNLPQATVKLASSTSYSAYCKNLGTGCQTQSRSSIGITVLYFPPAGPTPVTFGSVGTDYITVKWGDNSDNEDGFWVYRDTSPAFSNSIRVGDIAANTTSFIDYNLAEGATYYYRIIAHNRYDYGYSEVASRSTGVTPDKPALTASSTRIERGSNSNVSGSCRTGTLVWTAPTDFSGGSFQQSDQVTYSAKCLSDGIASGESYLTVTVYDKPTCTPPPAPVVSINGEAKDATVVRGSQIEVTATCSRGTLDWTAGRDNKSTSNKQSPNDDVTYTAVCQDGDCRSGEASRTVKMGTTTSGCTPPPAPVVSINGEAKDATVVRGSQIEVTATCSRGTLDWTAGRDNKSTSNKQSPNDDVTYTAVCQDGDCRSGEASRTVKMGTTTSDCTNPPPAPVVSINNQAKDITVDRGTQIEVTATCSRGTLDWTAGRDNKST